MPVNRGFDIEELIAACKRYPLTTRQRMTFEYVLLDGVNDAPEEAQRLAKLLRGIRGKVNLIPFNDWEGSSYRRPPLPRILAFQAILLEHGITATVRWSKGEDIGAACGQLQGAGGRMTPGAHHRVATLGCRLNQVESQEMRALLEGRGFRAVPSGRGADVVRGEHVHGHGARGASPIARRSAGSRRDSPGGARRGDRLLGADRIPPTVAGLRGVDLVVGNAGEVPAARSARFAAGAEPAAQRVSGPPRVEVSDIGAARIEVPAPRGPHRGPLARLRQDPGWLPAPLRLLHRAGRARRPAAARSRTRCSSRSASLVACGLPRGHADRRGHRPLRCRPHAAHEPGRAAAAPRRGAGAALAAAVVGAAGVLHGSGDRTS